MSSKLHLTYLNILNRLHIAIESGEDIVVDLHRNNGRKPEFEEIWQVRQDKKNSGQEEGDIFKLFPDIDFSFCI